MSCAARVEDPYTFTEPPVINSSNNHYSSHLAVNKNVMKPQIPNQLVSKPQPLVASQKVARFVTPNLLIRPPQRFNGQVIATNISSSNGLLQRPAGVQRVTPVSSNKLQATKQFLLPPVPAQLQHQKNLHHITIKAPSGQPATAIIKTPVLTTAANNQFVMAHQLQNKIVSINAKKPTVPLNHSNNSVTPKASSSATQATQSQPQQIQKQLPVLQSHIRAIQYDGSKTVPHNKLATGPLPVAAASIAKPPPAVKKLKKDLPAGKVTSSKNGPQTDWETVVDTSKTFIIPKVQAKSTPSDSVIDLAKKGKGGKILASRKTKRSHSNASFHETLQRIPSTAYGKKRASSMAAPIISVISSSKFASHNKEWHAPNTFIFDYDRPGPSTRFDELESNHLDHWFEEPLKDLKPPEQLFQDGATVPPLQFPVINLSRDQRLDLKRAHLRRQVVQYWQSQRFRTTQSAKHRLKCVINAHNKLQIKEETSQQCIIPSCTNTELAMATFCFSHIMSNKDQRLFQLCTAKFSDNSQCNSPVFDISHELPLCREHAWKRDNYNRITLEQKPKKSPRRKLKSSAMTRPTKKNRKKKKMAVLTKQQPQAQQKKDQVIVRTIPPVSNLQPPQIIQKPAKAAQPVSKSENNFHSGFSNFISNRANNVNPETPQKEYLTLCENSSAYESSEDTGVGGLSETEFMAHDGDIGQIIEEIPFEIENQDGEPGFIEEHELTNVLNHIEISEIFSDQNNTFEPTHDEQTNLELAIDEQLKRMATDSTTDFLGEFLANVDDLCGATSGQANLVHT